jgi:CheY-like chemotaxis protein
VSLSSAAKWFTLSLGERVGVRASLYSHCIDTAKWYHNCCPLRFMAEQKRILGRRILLVEDDQGARASIKLLLSIDRHAVVEASGGPEALELIKSQAFDLVILDYFMPAMRGSQLALHIREIAPALPIVMITAYLEKLTDSDRPVDAVIGKPFGIEELRGAIAKLLS